MEDQIGKSINDHKDKLIWSLIFIIKGYKDVFQLSNEIGDLASQISKLSHKMEEETC